MYKKLLFSLLFSLIVSFNYAGNNSTLFEQLKNLNKYWSVQPNTFPLNHTVETLGEKDIIQTHLLMVVDRLKAKPTVHLNNIQQQKRNNLLDELRTYANNRVFPINSYHLTRTPYFIDEKGTACAVGHLIIKSGHSELARFISERNNYDFIEDMPHQQELSVWAHEFGFEVDELKWIQPSYGPSCNPGQVRQPLCKDGVGCFNPNWQLDGLVAPVTYLSEFNDGTGWVVDSSNIWMVVGARIGQHRITITGSNNATMVYLYTISNVPAIPITATVVDQSSGAFCNGQVSLSVNNTSGITYQYELINTQMNYYRQSATGVFDSLCTGTYLARASTTFNCFNSINVVVNNSTGLSQNNFAQYVKIQNPIQHSLPIDISLNGQKQVKIFDLLGSLVFERSMDGKANFDLTKLEDGLYILQIEFKGNVYSRKIVKTN